MVPHGERLVQRELPASLESLETIVWKQLQTTVRVRSSTWRARLPRRVGRHANTSYTYLYVHFLHWRPKRSIRLTFILDSRSTFNDRMFVGTAMLALTDQETARDTFVLMRRTKNFGVITRIAQYHRNIASSIEPVSVDYLWRCDADACCDPKQMRVNGTGVEMCLAGNSFSAASTAVSITNSTRRKSSIFPRVY